MLLASAACSDTGTTGGDTAAPAQCGGKIAIFGAFTGANAGLVLPARDGALLAVKQHNAANPNCKVEIEPFDTTGAADQATPIANQVAGNATFTSVIGGMFSGETKATTPIYEGAGLVMVSPSATAAELTAGGSKVFHRVVGNDLTQGAAAVTYIKNTLKSTKVFLIDDGTPYGAGIGAEIQKGLGATVVSSDKVQTEQTNFSATVSKIKASGADVIAYAGYTSEAAPMLKQARAAGITAKFLGFDGLYDPGFPAGAGNAAVEGAIVTCPCLPAEKAGGTFAADYEAEYKKAAGSYGAEGYDAAKILTEGYAAGKKTRAELLAWVDAYDKQGSSKYLKFDPTGDVSKDKVAIWSYEVKGGKFVPQQEIKLS